ncbi:helicase-related protein [Commensalibacter oyaizuii]|uniref:Helicase-related protein n=1 Tax=Commensalibacter oyaizuii TaxID=3043873 RepID=A0ABT6PZ81_9PROT|nr:helicase-related protein [Commensalibacter sp. TBRC 16381]MDI2090040.1 helicase-related protein [Commensalibacter sp. TBRC 16381]
MSSTHHVKAILGPTNTGKTHLAIERMMAHSSGIIGFPLRLLAKENYDRMVSLKGEKYVALITGEEKIIPPTAKWFSCTVEAMPITTAVDFIAIDEIQLCADPDRGHIFTDRLLNCRGNIETMFLGADTMTPILKQLIPGIEIESRPRLSLLNYSGFSKITKLPSRCAIVAFSATEVYAIAEFIKRKHGGCAIVMGRLSPRTRNAQMELYQNKDVDYLVATDAIGMGLNMNVNHVAFASLSKFDGRQMRNLFATEIAQIAGRAGRGMRDGTFGTTANCHAISEKIINSVENHHFDTLKQVYWRNHHLDFSNPSTLLHSLTHAPPLKTLIAGNHASDLQTLVYLIQDPEIMAACSTQEKTQLLWENCQIPDFKKLGGDSHARICKKTFLFLLKQGYVPETWLNQQIEQLNHPYGDIDTLMQRLSGIRICAYIATKNQWVEHAPYWQAQAREVEDRLSDALHTALMSRFVNQRATSLIRNLNSHEKNDLLTSITPSGDILIEGHSIGTFKGLSLVMKETLADEEHKLALKSIRKNINAIIPRQINKIVDANHNEFSLDYKAGYILWEQTPIARLKKGLDLLHPEITLFENEFLNDYHRQVIIKKLQHYVTAIVRNFFPKLLISKNKNIPVELRGILHQIYENGGILWKSKTYNLSKDNRRFLYKHGILTGPHAIYIKNIFKEKISNLRIMLFHIYHHSVNFSILPASSQICINALTDFDVEFMRYLGWMPAGTQFIRIDIAEKITNKLIHKAQLFPNAFNKQTLVPLPYQHDNINAILKAFNFFTQKAQSLSKLPMGPPAPLLFAAYPFQKSNKPKKLHHTFKRNQKKPQSTRKTFLALKQFYENNRYH